MIHPQDWSLSSIWLRLKYGNHDKRRFGSTEDVKLSLDYLKPNGRRVLDLGAANGDTARIFLHAGASHVICVEKDRNLTDAIPRSPRVTVLNETASPDHLKRQDWDVCKIDIEGYELGLLPALERESRPIFLESHNWYVNEQMEKIGFHYLSATRLTAGQCWMGKP